MPQRVFKRKSNGKSNKNFESSFEELRIDDAESRRKSDANASTLSKIESGFQGGSLIPNRIFVGGIATSVTEWDLRSRFLSYGTVKAVKIIRDHLGISKGYGFITFNSKDEAKRALEKTEMTFKGRKLNIAPAIKKQSYRSEAQSLSEIYAESYSGSSIAEQDNSRKCNMVYSKISEYSGFTGLEVATNSYDNPNPYNEGGISLSATDLQCAYGNTQVNIVPYPTLVYLPQQAFQCPGASVTYPITSTIPEIIQLLPAPICCLNESNC
ncbi:protein boule-like [Trichonephila clavata]|uniref:Protein boule-like n=1 Tax=Trichonephila clavata TaxID=2740835 RepID=A0A8X6KS33_TRICU|nr:protein boule-like [Trichonephila clavata]